MKTDTLRCWLSRSCCGDPLCNLGATVHFPPETRRTSWMNSVPRFPRRNTFTFKTSPGGFLCLLETWESLCCQQHAVFLLRRWSVWKSPLWRGRVGWSPPPMIKKLHLSMVMFPEDQQDHIHHTSHTPRTTLLCFGSWSGCSTEETGEQTQTAGWVSARLWHITCVTEQKLIGTEPSRCQGV